MRMRIISAAVFLSLGIVVMTLAQQAGERPKDRASEKTEPRTVDPKSEEKRFQDTWTENAIENARGRFLQRAQSGYITRTFIGDRFVDISGGIEAGRGTFVLNSARSPKAIDLIFDPNPRLPPPPPGSRDEPDALRGIYEFKGDTLRICVSRGKRPQSFFVQGDDYIIELIKRKPE